MKITKSELRQRCIDNETAIATLETLLKEHGIVRKQEPKLKQLDQSVFDGLDERWRFAAVDGSKGFPVVYEYEPHLLELEGYYTNRDGLYKDLEHMKGYDDSNWQNSLIERDKVELTGSDLCRAMLERGDRCVMCFVANNEANMFLATRPVVVHGCNDSGFISASGCYSFAVAVNNQGEPLTAADVGL